MGGCAVRGWCGWCGCFLVLTSCQLTGAGSNVAFCVAHLTIHHYCDPIPTLHAAPCGLSYKHAAAWLPN